MFDRGWMSVFQVDVCLSTVDVCLADFCLVVVPEVLLALVVALFVVVLLQLDAATTLSTQTRNRF
jgi:hypothetical protein